ncbi:MAG: alpha/beta hydrolase-fold protein [bacterium]
MPAELDNGSEGLNPFNNPAHVRPVEACADTLHATAESLVMRILPRGPLRNDGRAAFTAGACVYLPPGYVDSGLAYPVLYLLHGGGGDQADWVTYGGIQSIMDAAIAADASNAAIVLMPDGANAQWYDAFDGSVQNQRYLFDFLIPYVERHFHAIAGRDGRAIDGLSNGGYGALHFAAKRPDRFAVVGAMSSNLAALSFDGLAATQAPAFFHGSLPIDLATNLDGLDLIMNIGTECITDQTRDNCLAFQFEQIFVPANRDFSARLAAVRGPGDGVLDYREGEGAHSWNWWPLWLRDGHLPFLLARLADPRPASSPVPPTPTPRPSFRFRSVAPDFAVWDYAVSVQRDVREFLDLRDVTADGLVVRGSGSATIRTAARYAPHAPYRVSGAGPVAQLVFADDDGRLALAVDLGPSHTLEQFTPAQIAAEAAGDYWVVRTIAIAAAED